jgi:hypothetical protein
MRIASAVLTALLLTVVVGVSGASASTLTDSSESYTEVRGAPVGNQSFSIDGYGSECSGFALGGESIKSAESVTFSSSGSTSCNFGSTNLNGCQLTMHFGAQRPTGIFAGTIDIGPSGCGPITVDNAGCHFTISPKSGLKAHFENIGSGSTAKVVAYLEGQGLSYTHSGSTCGSHSGENGIWYATWNLFSFEQGLKLTDAHAPRFEAEQYPVSLAGSQESGAPLQFKFGVSTAKCNAVSLLAGAEGPSSSLAVHPFFGGGCTAFGFGNAQVNAGSCTFVLHAGSAIVERKTYSGTFDLSCPEGSPLTISVNSLGSECKVSMSSQSGVAGVTFENVSEGVYSLKTTLNLSGLTYTTLMDTNFCPLSGTGTRTNGGLTGSFTLSNEGNGFYIMGA